MTVKRVKEKLSFTELKKKGYEVIDRWYSKRGTHYMMENGDGYKRSVIVKKIVDNKE